MPWCFKVDLRLWLLSHSISLTFQEKPIWAVAVRFREILWPSTWPSWERPGSIHGPKYHGQKPILSFQRLIDILLRVDQTFLWKFGARPWIVRRIVSKYMTRKLGKMTAREENDENSRDFYAIMVCCDNSKISFTELYKWLVRGWITRFLGDGSTGRWRNTRRIHTWTILCACVLLCFFSCRELVAYIRCAYFARGSHISEVLSRLLILHRNQSK